MSKADMPYDDTKDTRLNGEHEAGGWAEIPGLKPRAKGLAATKSAFADWAVPLQGMEFPPAPEFRLPQARWLLITHS
jgi:hypothetical protein